MDLAVSVPGQNTRWRLKIIYGTENRGPALLLTKVELGIEHRSVSGQTTLSFIAKFIAKRW